MAGRRAWRRGRAGESLPRHHRRKRQPAHALPTPLCLAGAAAQVQERAGGQAEMSELHQFNDWIGPVVYLLTTLFIGWIGWSVKRRFVPREDHDKLNARVEKVETRVTTVENKVADLPSAKDAQALAVRMTELTGELKVFDQRFRAMESAGARLQLQIDRIELFLRQQKSE
ncbi:MAG: DUF2730 family protein [Alphaproteobacteria bacterium]|nr:DUF2730 family protein [Alphaproteobacteria bacterium]